MPFQMNSDRREEILTLLKELPEEDRVLLGLFIYENLSDRQVNTILNTREKHTEKPIMEKESI